ncbi:MAG: SDR family oxidoreductase [Gemmatimonadaceae bacterium]|nr:SDR family oxidoreductase [Gemmatimonadaceae bacterium]
MELGLGGRVVLITGGASGIGAAIARELVAEGARPVLVDRNAAALAAMQAALPSVRTVQAELRAPGACADAVAQALAAAGAIDAVINNAGVNDCVGLEHGTPALFRDSMDINLHHYYDTAHAALPALKLSAASGDWQPSILNVSSKVAMTGQGGTSGYAAAKGAILALTRDWAVELLPYNMRVNALVPAEVMTPLYRSWLDSLPDPAAREARITTSIPLGKRMTTPAEIAAMACFLLSARASHITGQHVHVDGGYVHLDRTLT